MAAIAIYDETTLGDKIPSSSLNLSVDRITVRELICQRVSQEVTNYNEHKSEYFQGLIQPRDSERSLNGYKLRHSRKLDLDKQIDLALAAFQTNGFILLIDDRQVDDLEAELELDESSSVSFLKLIPLVGG
jgi:hypothetical protein